MESSTRPSQEMTSGHPRPLPPLSRMMALERRRARRRLWTGLAFMAPAILFVAVFLLYPVAFNVYVSLTQWAKFSGFDRFAGLENYVLVFTSPKFGEAALNTGIWIVASLVFPVVLGLALALLLRGLQFQEALKSVFFLPRMFSATAVGVIWYYVYGNQGIINSFLRGLGLGGLVERWLYEPLWATPSMILTHVWQTVGLIMVLLLLGLNALPSEPIEAAKVDGAGRWQVFRHVILPLLMPTLLVVTIVSVLAGFTSFDLVWVMGRDYPNRSTLTLAVNQYWESFRANQWAYGSAIAVILGFFALGVTWIQTVLQHRLERR
ncbi:MAG: sugar ABC transporter permease [Methylobacteriaceae bacterium]|nr:sugar ABC transporter permease [Methylobacteriaceae bacterium]